MYHSGYFGQAMDVECCFVVCFDVSNNVDVYYKPVGSLVGFLGCSTYGTVDGNLE